MPGRSDISEAGTVQGDVLELSFATWDHDRVMALHEGSVEIEGVRLRSVIAPTSELFPAAVADAPYDITEMSISSYVLQVARGEGAYIALPAFVARSFRHQGFFARAGSGIESPADFKGRRIGVPEYQMTAALWMRGILRDEYAVNAEVAPITEGETLQDLLIAGEIDGLLAPKPPQAFLDGDRRFIRLFPDYEAAERAYHEKTGFFPIMHVIGVRRTLLEAYPWLARKLYDALVAGKKVALDRLKALWLSNANRVSLPWFGAGVERTMDAFGPDWWPYGFAANRAELDAICRYSVEQHLAGQRVAPEALFPKDLLTT